MTRRILLLLLLVASAAPTLPAEAANAAGRFRNGVTLYRNGEYREAIRVFEGLVAEGYASTDLYYNLGSASYKNGDLGKSILSYERARLLTPGDEDIAHNLKVVRARLRDRVDPIPLLFFVRWWNDLKTGNTPEQLFIWSLVFFWLLATAAFIFFGFRAVLLRRVALGGGVLFLVLCAVFLTLSVNRSSEIGAHRRAVIMSAEQTVRSTPDASGVESFVVHEGLTVEILDARDDFYRIRLDDGKTGWIEREALERI